MAGYSKGVNLAAPAGQAESLYNCFVEIMRNYEDITVNTGRFQTMMMVEIHNDGPVTMLLDSNKKF